MSIIDAKKLQRLVDTAKELDSPHVNLGPLLGLQRPLLAEVDDLHKLVQSQYPSFELSYDNVFLTAQPTGALTAPDGATFTIGVRI